MLNFADYNLPLSNGATFGEAFRVWMNTDGVYNVNWHWGMSLQGCGALKICNYIVPITPSDLTATAVSSTQINLSWTDNSSDEQGFTIWQGPGDKGPFNQIASVGPNVTTYSNTGLTPGTAYYYIVEAYNLSGNSGWSNHASATTPMAYTISASAGANGSISPSGSVKVNSGASQTFTITPNSGYAVSAVTVDGSNKGAITSYTFSNVTANHTISATFVLNLKIEAENGVLSGGAKKNTNHSGYSGTGFVDGYVNNTTAKDSLIVNVPAAGSYRVKLHYSAGGGASSNTGLYVNGTKIKNISCAATSNWDTWADELETVTLKAGNNGIVYKAVTSSAACINLDYVIVSQ